MTKIIQTFWNASKDDILLNTGGYACPEIHWMSWAFSCLQLRKFYPRVEMYTNEAGKELFELLEIPYTKIHTTLEDNEFMENLMPELWAYSKIHTYSIQQEPFLHVDGDVFIWKPFDEKLLNSPLVAQNLEDNMEIYIEMIKTIDKYIPYKPDWLEYNKSHPKAYNAGVIGGENYNFFKEYAKIARDFYLKNKNAFKKMKANHENVNAINLIFEQYLYYVLSEQQNKKVRLFTDKVVCVDGDNDYFFDIRKVPAFCQYLHFLGGSKKQLYINHYIDYLMQIEYSKYRQKIISIFKERNLLNSYMKHIIGVKKNNRNRNILNPFSGHTPLENRIDGIALVKKNASEINICKCLKNSFYEIAEMDDSFLTKHPIFKDVAGYQKIKNNFLKQDFNKHAISQTNLFIFYKNFRDVFQSENFMDYYIFVNPYHYIYVTSYNWNSILEATDEDGLDIYEKQDLILLYLDINNNIINSRMISKFLVDFMENVKLKPTTIGKYAENKGMNLSEIETFISLLKRLQIEGIVYFSNNVNEFILQAPSERFLPLLKNFNTQISKLLKFIFNHYGITNYDENKIVSLDSLGYQQIASIGDVLNLIKNMNFNAMALKTKIDFIKDIPLPAILLLEDRIYDDACYVVLTSISNKKVNVYNPEFDKIVSYSFKSFDELWGKKLIVLNPQM